MDDGDDDDFEEMEAALMEEQDRAKAAAEGSIAEAAVAPPSSSAAPDNRSRKRARGHGEHGDGGLGSLAFAASASCNDTGSASAPIDDDDDEAAAGYWMGMNILTGRSREEDEADGLVAPRKFNTMSSEDGASRPSQELVQLNYGTYQGLQLGHAEVRRIKAEECESMLRNRKLVRIHACMHARLPRSTHSPFPSAFTPTLTP